MGVAFFFGILFLFLWKYLIFVLRVLLVPLTAGLAFFIFMGVRLRTMEKNMSVGFFVAAGVNLAVIAFVIGVMLILA